MTWGMIEMVKSSLATYRYELRPGTRTISISLDTNLNNRLDNYCFGRPREQQTFSNNARGFMGPPWFEEAAFSVGGEAELFATL